MKTSVIFVLSLFCFSIFAMGERRSQTFYIALGDSMTAGFLAYTKTSQKWPYGEETVLRTSESDIEDGDDYEEPPPPYLWNGWRYATLMESKRTFSWATGSKSHSVSERLQEWLESSSAGNGPTDLRSYNLAESGIRAEHLPRQARLAVKKLKKLHATSLSLVTIIFGANDVCESPVPRIEDEINIRTNFKRALLNLSKAKDFLKDPHPIRVFVSAIPNIPSLARPEIQNHRSFLGMSCRKVWNDVINGCKKLTDWTNESEYQSRLERVEFINNAIRLAAEDMKDDPRFSITYDDTLYRTKLTGPMLAIDCFHAGKTGQKGLAEIFWNAMPWFR